MSEQPRAQRPRRKLLFVAWTLLWSVLLLEGVLQVGALFFKAAPEDLGAEVNPDAVRVLAVGDSWVEGAEAPEGQGFVDHLGREFSAALGGREVQVFNLGRTGANSAHVALTVLDEVARIQPDLVVVLVGQNNASNFYRVAEVEERLGLGVGRRRLGDRVRTVKLARILWANVRGGSGYTQAERRELPSIPAVKTDSEGHPVLQAPLLEGEAGRGYLDRAVAQPPPPTGDPVQDLAWEVLYATARRDLGGAARAAGRLVELTGWPSADSRPSAPVATSDSELLARYALMRLARAQRAWRAVRYHSGAAVSYSPRGVLSDLASAEAHLLGGDWRSARALLSAAHARAPGFYDTIDLAARFPDQARDPELYEALEYAPRGELADYEQAVILRYAHGDPQGAIVPSLRWAQEHPEDLRSRVDLAVWMVENGQHDRADELMSAQVSPESGFAAAPTSPEPDLWRFHVARAASTGDRSHTLNAVAEATQIARPVDAPLLGVLAEALAGQGFCDELPAMADSWFAARGDANGYAQVLAPCIPPAEAAERLSGLRAQWGPLGDEQQWTALVRAGRKPFELLYRDLDLVVSAVEPYGAGVLVLNYPNPSEDHTALREILGDYTANRPVYALDLWGHFASRFDEDAWAERLGPNGHCNAIGYRVMADAILEWASAQPSVAGPPRRE